MMASAARKPEFAGFAATGLNLEAMVAAIGEVKSGMGDETLNPQLRALFMFGCDRKVQGAAGDVYSNAYCAAKDLTAISTTACAAAPSDPACYFNAYNGDPNNEATGLLSISGEEFTEVYKAWNGYAWRAS